MKYDLNGVHVLNKFIWGQLKSQEFMTDIDYRGMVPIIPTQQHPAFNDMSTGTPFIVYTYVVSGYDANIWSNIEQVTYRIFGDNERQIRQITNFLIDLLKRYDWTAQEVNDWLERNSGVYPVNDNDDQAFDFKWVTVAGGSSPEPSDQEDGRQYSSITVRMAYVHSEIKGVSGPWLGMKDYRQ